MAGPPTSQEPSVLPPPPMDGTVNRRRTRHHRHPSTRERIRPVVTTSLYTASAGNEMHRSSPAPDARPLISERPEFADLTHHRPWHDAEPSASAREHPHRPGPPPTSSTLHRCARGAGTVRTAAAAPPPIKSTRATAPSSCTSLGPRRNSRASLTTPPAGPRASLPCAATSPGDRQGTKPMRDCIDRWCVEVVCRSQCPRMSPPSWPHQSIGR